MTQDEAKPGIETTQAVTRLLLQWTDGDARALDHLLPLVYDELRRLAQSYLRRENVGHTLQSTALVHEAYLRLVDQRDVNWQNRSHFFGIAAQMMRRVLVDHARAHHAAKRGSGGIKVTLDEGLVAAEQRDVNVIALDDALNKLAEMDPQQSRVVELRFFAGLSIEETAEVMKISPATVKRDWAMAKAWLYGEMNG
jgi:RNA polymerase sigma factor (TIGR02999 family)